jgi:predicted membrane protein (TIGR00267 family)
LEKKVYSEIYIQIKPYLINTIFDSSFTILGILVALAFTQNLETNILIKTIITGCFSLGISSGVSVYEAESLISERKILELEKALLHNLDNTVIRRRKERKTIIIALSIFFTPIMTGILSIIPFLINLDGLLINNVNIFGSVSSVMILLFFTRYILSEDEESNKFMKSLRMALFGIISFILGYFVQAQL